MFFQSASGTARRYCGIRDSLSHGLADFAVRNRRPPCPVHGAKVHGCAPVRSDRRQSAGQKKSPQVVWVPPAASIEIWLASLLACQCLRGGSRRPKSMCICTNYIHGRKREGAMFYRAREGTRHARRECNLHTFFCAHVMCSDLRSTGTRPITRKCTRSFEDRASILFRNPASDAVPSSPESALCILLISVVRFKLDGSGDSSAATHPPRTACTYLCAKSRTVHFWPQSSRTTVLLNLFSVTL